MNNSIYGGILYPNSSFHIDKIYSNFKEANDNAANDNVLLGRYVLIAYTELPLSYSRREVIKSQYYTKNNADAEKAEIVSTNISNVLDLTTEEIRYRENYVLDGYIDYDRILCRKAYENNTFVYEPIANLSTSIDLASGYKVDENNNPIQATDEAGNLLFWDDAKTLPRYELTDNNFLQAFDDIVWAFDHLDDQLDDDLKRALEQEGKLRDATIEGQTQENNLWEKIERAQEEQSAIDEKVAEAENIINAKIEKAKQDADAQIAKVEAAITNANSQEQSLINTTTLAQSQQIALQSVIDSVPSVSSGLQNIIDNANGTKTVLNETINEATATNQNLQDTIDNANSTAAALKMTWGTF